MIIRTLHKVGSGILCILLPDFQVGGRNRYNPVSEIPDDKSFSHLPQHSLFSEMVYLYWEKEGKSYSYFEFKCLVCHLIDLNCWQGCVSGLCSDHGLDNFSSLADQELNPN